MDDISLTLGIDVWGPTDDDPRTWAQAVFANIEGGEMGGRKVGFKAHVAGGDLSEEATRLAVSEFAGDVAASVEGLLGGTFRQWWEQELTARAELRALQAADRERVSLDNMDSRGGRA